MGQDYEGLPWNLNFSWTYPAGIRKATCELKEPECWSVLKQPFTVRGTSFSLALFLRICQETGGTNHHSADFADEKRKRLETAGVFTIDRPLLSEIHLPAPDICLLRIVVDIGPYVSTPAQKLFPRNKDRACNISIKCIYFYGV